MLSTRLFKFRASRRGSSIDKSSKIINPENIVIGNNCRVGAYSFIEGGKDESLKLVISDNVIIKRFSYITARHASVTIGSYSMISHRVFIVGKGNIIIGDNCMIGINTQLISSNHDYFNISVPYYEIPELAEDIHIENNVWIGSQCVILPGVRVGEGSVIGAGAIVTKSISPNTLAAGNPAAAIRKINRI